MTDNTNDMNARIRRERSLLRRQQPKPEPEPEPEPAEPVDLGAGPRASVEGSDPDAFRKWLYQQVHRSKLESVTVNADPNAMRRKP